MMRNPSTRTRAAAAPLPGPGGFVPREESIHTRRYAKMKAGGIAPSLSIDIEPTQADSAGPAKKRTKTLDLGSARQARASAEGYSASRVFF